MIYLIGYMGAGKTSAARHLSKMMGVKYIDLDDYIIERIGMPISEYFEKYGEEEFRDRESEALRDVVNEGVPIISCGGGAVLRENNVTLMKKSGEIIYLKVSPETVYKRLKGDSKRPLLSGNMNVEFITNMMEKRNLIYTNAADEIVICDDISSEEVAKYLSKRV